MNCTARNAVSISRHVQAQNFARRALELTQDKCYRDMELDAGFNNTLTHIRGYPRSPYAKLDASAALVASGALPAKVNYAVKSSFLLSFVESVPKVSARLKPPPTATGNLRMW